MVAVDDLLRIARLDLAVLELPDSHPAADLGRTIPVHGFAIRHPDGVILVDTGVGVGNDLIDQLYQPTIVDLEKALLGQGIDVRDVVAVVNSHLHFDHCGQNPLLFGGAVPFFAQAAEIDAVDAESGYTDRSWALAPWAQRRRIVGDEEIAEGVTIIATPGHTAGHQSVLVEAGDRRVVIGAQVVWHGPELDDEVASAANVDPVPELQAAAVESICRIKALHPEVVHLSHCPAHRPPTVAGAPIPT